MLMIATGLSERRACSILSLYRSTARYEHRPCDDAAVREQIRAIAFERRRFGYRRIWAKLRRKGDVINHKRVYRLYSEENLKVRRRPRKRLAANRGIAPIAIPDRPNVRWSMDFMSDSLYSGRRFRTLNVVDDCTRESLGIEVAFSLPSQRVTRVLDRLIWTYGKPEKITVDNGPEFRSKHTQKWADQHGIFLDYIDPGKPIQNAFIESFNSKVRDECLNDHWFVSLDEAEREILRWREDYNTERPHSSLQYQTPAEVRQNHLAKAV